MKIKELQTIINEIKLTESQSDLFKTKPLYVFLVNADPDANSVSVIDNMISVYDKKINKTCQQVIEKNINKYIAENNSLAQTREMVTVVNNELTNDMGRFGVNSKTGVFETTPGIPGGQHKNIWISDSRGYYFVKELTFKILKPGRPTAVKRKIFLLTTKSPVDSFLSTISPATLKNMFRIDGQNNGLGKIE